jgi:hypothetical protein
MARSWAHLAFVPRPFGTISLPNDRQQMPGRAIRVKPARCSPVTYTTSFNLYVIYSKPGLPSLNAPHFVEKRHFQYGKRRKQIQKRRFCGGEDAPIAEAGNSSLRG